MKVNVNAYSMAVLSDVFKKKKQIQVEMSGSTLQDLVQILKQKYGKPLQKALLDEEGQVSWDVRIIKNMEEFLGDDRMNSTLKEGDTLYFMVCG